MASIRAVRVALPERSYDNSQICEAAKRWLAGSSSDYALFERFLISSRTLKRSFVIPLDEILELKSPEKRVEIFEREATRLAGDAVRASLAAAEIAPSDVAALVFTSCTSPVIPSIDGSLVAEMGLAADIKRVPVYQWGCAGGVLGLGLAERFARDGRPTLMVAAELCSLVFQHGDHSAGHLVGSAIFGDGAAAVTVSPEDTGLVIVDTHSTLLPNTRHIMGYDIMDDGSHLRLDKQLPSVLAEGAPGVVDHFLSKRGLVAEDIDYWLFHPGGTKILNLLEEKYCSGSAQGHFSRQALARYGNLSSASVLFVLHDFLKEAHLRVGDRVVMLGVGPGLTVELIYFEVR